MFTTEAPAATGGKKLSWRPPQRGLTLIELIIFIVVIGVGLAGITLTYNTVVRHSPDPVVRKQALSIADSLLQEIEQQAFTWCDPQDANVASASNHDACTISQAPLGPQPASESRENTANPFDNVADYAGYRATGDVLFGNAQLRDYSASVTITQVGESAPFTNIPKDAVLRIQVQVVGRGETVTLVGYRTRHAPNAGG